MYVVIGFLYMGLTPWCRKVWLSIKRGFSFIHYGQFFSENYEAIKKNFENLCNEVY